MSSLAEPASANGNQFAFTPGWQGTNASVPNVARIYDFLLGGKDNFASDRVAAEALTRAVPDAVTACRQNRQFLKHAVQFLAQSGIRQFIDIGTGLPTQGNVHEIARKINSATRVLYVDNDPVVVSHAQALLVDSPTVVAINRDLRNPREIISHPACQALIDLDKPVAILLIAILHFIPDDDDPYKVVDELKAAMPAGSFLVISHVTDDDMPPEASDQARELYRRSNAPAAPRTQDMIMRFFDGLEMVPPGLVNVSAWRHLGEESASNRTIFYAGVGKKAGGMR